MYGDRDRDRDLILFLDSALFSCNCLFLDLVSRLQDMLL